MFQNNKNVYIPEWHGEHSINLEKCWYTLSDLGEKNPFPWPNVDPSRVVKSLARSPNIDLMGVGKDYG